MSSFEEKLDLYIKAGMPKKAVLEKIEGEFGIIARNQAEEFFLKDENKKSIKRKKKIVLFFAVALIFCIVLFFLYFFIFNYLDNSSFSSSKCADTNTISIKGNSDFQLRIYGALERLEDVNCGYLEFISSNFPEISSETGAGDLSIYYPLSHSMSPNYTGSDYFVANAIIHQACHLYQLDQNSPQNEHDCALTQYNFLLSIGAPKADVQKIVSLKSNKDYFFDEKNIDVYTEWFNKTKKST